MIFGKTEKPGTYENILAGFWDMVADILGIVPKPVPVKENRDAHDKEHRETRPRDLRGRHP